METPASLVDGISAAIANVRAERTRDVATDVAVLQATMDSNVQTPNDVRDLIVSTTLTALHERAAAFAADAERAPLAPNETPRVYRLGYPGADEDGDEDGAALLGGFCFACERVAPEGSVFVPCEDCHLESYCSEACRAARAVLHRRYCASLDAAQRRRGQEAWLFAHGGFNTAFDVCLAEARAHLPASVIGQVTDADADAIKYLWRRVETLADRIGKTTFVYVKGAASLVALATAAAADGVAGLGAPALRDLDELRRTLEFMDDILVPARGVERRRRYAASDAPTYIERLELARVMCQTVASTLQFAGLPATPLTADTIASVVDAALAEKSAAEIHAMYASMEQFATEPFDELAPELKYGVLPGNAQARQTTRFLTVLFSVLAFFWFGPYADYGGAILLPAVVLYSGFYSWTLAREVRDLARATNETAAYALDVLQKRKVAADAARAYFWDPYAPVVVASPRDIADTFMADGRLFGASKGNSVGTPVPIALPASLASAPTLRLVGTLQASPNGLLFDATDAALVRNRVGLEATPRWALAAIDARSVQVATQAAMKGMPVHGYSGKRGVAGALATAEVSLENSMFSLGEDYSLMQRTVATHIATMVQSMGIQWFMSRFLKPLVVDHSLLELYVRDALYAYFGVHRHMPHNADDTIANYRPFRDDPKYNQFIRLEYVLIDPLDPNVHLIAADWLRINADYTGRSSVTHGSPTLEILLRLYFAHHVPGTDRASNMSPKLLEFVRARVMELIPKGDLPDDDLANNTVDEHQQAVENAFHDLFAVLETAGRAAMFKERAENGLDAADFDTFSFALGLYEKHILRGIARGFSVDGWKAKIVERLPLISDYATLPHIRATPEFHTRSSLRQLRRTYGRFALALFGVNVGKLTWTWYQCGAPLAPFYLMSVPLAALTALDDISQKLLFFRGLTGDTATSAIVTSASYSLVGSAAVAVLLYLNQIGVLSPIVKYVKKKWEQGTSVTMGMQPGESKITRDVMSFLMTSIHPAAFVLFTLYRHVGFDTSLVVGATANILLDEIVQPFLLSAGLEFGMRRVLDFIGPAIDKWRHGTPPSQPPQPPDDDWNEKRRRRRSLQAVVPRPLAALPVPGTSPSPLSTDPRLRAWEVALLGLVGDREAPSALRQLRESARGLAQAFVADLRGRLDGTDADTTPLLLGARRAYAAATGSVLATLRGALAVSSDAQTHVADVVGQTLMEHCVALTDRLCRHARHPLPEQEPRPPHVTYGMYHDLDTDSDDDTFVDAAEASDNMMREAARSVIVSTRLAQLVTDLASAGLAAPELQAVAAAEPVGWFGRAYQMPLTVLDRLLPWWAAPPAVPPPLAPASMTISPAATSVTLALYDLVFREPVLERMHVWLVSVLLPRCRGLTRQRLEVALKMVLDVVPDLLVCGAYTAIANNHLGPSFDAVVAAELLTPAALRLLRDLVLWPTRADVPPNPHSLYERIAATDSRARRTFGIYLTDTLQFMSIYAPVAFVGNAVLGGPELSIVQQVASQPGLAAMLVATQVAVHWALDPLGGGRAPHQSDRMYRMLNVAWPMLQSAYSPHAVWNLLVGALALTTLDPLAPLARRDARGTALQRLLWSWAGDGEVWYDPGRLADFRAVTDAMRSALIARQREEASDAEAEEEEEYAPDATPRDDMV